MAAVGELVIDSPMMEIAYRLDDGQSQSVTAILVPVVTEASEEQAFV
jgi:hypothetical protein